MWTPRDRQQAYQFLRRRLISAVQTGDANHPVPPARRLVVGSAVGVAAALIISAGFGIYGALRPGASQNWQRGGQVIIERETGGAYVMGADGLLHPVLNYSSARLLAGGDGKATVTVSVRSLAGAARGAQLGIPGAPDSLPPRLVTGPWTVCAAPATDRTGVATTATIGVAVPGTPVDADRAVVVRSGDELYAVVAGHRLRIRDTTTAVALGYDSVPAVPVTPAWLSSVPSGPDLAPITVASSGTTGPMIGGLSTVVGQVVAVENVGQEKRYYGVRTNGLQPITETEAALSLGNPANKSAYRDGPPRAIAVAASDIVGRLNAAQTPAGFPTRIPTPVVGTTQQSAVCATGSGDDDGVALVVTDSVRLPATSRGLPVAGGADARTADRIAVPPSSGALVREVRSAADENGAVYLVTDQGVRYPVDGADALRSLGYGGVQPTPVAANWLALLPEGVGLSVAAAQRIV